MPTTPDEYYQDPGGGIAAFGRAFRRHFLQCRLHDGHGPLAVELQLCARIIRRQVIVQLRTIQSAAALLRAPAVALGEQEVIEHAHEKGPEAALLALGLMQDAFFHQIEKERLREVRGLILGPAAAERVLPHGLPVGAAHRLQSRTPGLIAMQ